MAFFLLRMQVLAQFIRMVIYLVQSGAIGEMLGGFDIGSMLGGFDIGSMLGGLDLGGMLGGLLG